ncbi:MAG TPA: hypothetical protein DET40_07705 [Lentisphaeria bacterium]|nr:MAG: hypothetical protein A2X45_06590 [Lentisphaerae bacterium GWF2_50_93]HCE43418.1 hypothetical protein [Lentisphaeria bacterium]
MRISCASLGAFIGLSILGSAFGQTVYQDDFEAKFQAVPAKEKGWNANADITGEVGANWGDNSSWAEVGIAYSRDEVNPHSGKASQRIDVKRVSSGAVQFTHPFKAEKGKVYLAKLWMRGLGNASITYGFRQKDAPWQIPGSETVALSPEWREFSIQAEIPNDDQMFLMLWIHSPSSYWIDDASIEIVDLSKLPTPPEGNMFSNSSFEAGIPENWVFHAEGSDTVKLRDLRPRIVDGGAVGGKSVCVDILKDGSGYLRSPMLSPTKGQSYSVSLWLKASRDVQIDAGLIDTNLWSPKISANTEWKRFTFSAKVDKFRKVSWLQISFPQLDSDYSVFVDGVMLEAKPEPAKEFSEQFPYEFVVGTDRPGHIFFDEEKAMFKLSAAPSPKDDVKAKIAVQDFSGKELGTSSFKLIGNGMFIINADNLKRGMFKLSAMLVDADGKQVSPAEEISWARIPRPADMGDGRDSYFGIHIPMVGDYIQIARLSGQRWVRLHDSSMIAKWNSLEPKEGDFRFYDENISLAKKEGLMILGMLDGAPPWMGSKDRGGYWGFWTIPTRADWKEKWRYYCNTAITHYKGRIDDWEIWNEPWGEWFFSAGGDPAMYVEFMRQAKESTAANNPSAQIIGVDTYAGHEKWTEAALKGGTDVYDVFSYHDYSDALAGGAAAVNRCQQQADLWRSWQARFGKVKPIWNTEGGVMDLGSFMKPRAGGMHFETQPSYIVRYDTCLRAAGVQKFFYYAIHLDPAEGENSCRATDAGRAVKPLLAARAIFAWLTDGAAFKERTETDGVECYAFEPVRGRQVTVCWSIDGQDKKFIVPAGSSVLDIWGNEMARKDGAVAVGNTPVYIVD